MARRRSCARRTSCSRATRRRRAEVLARLIVGRAGLGRAAQATSSCSCCRSGCPARSASRCARRCIRSLLGACGRNVVFGQNVVLRHPHKIRIGDNVVIDDNCLIDAKGDDQSPASRSAAACSSGATPSCRARTATSTIGDGANIGFNCEMFSASRVDASARDTLLAAYCYVIGGDHDLAAIRRSRCSSRAASRTGVRDRRGRLARRGRQDSRRGDDRRRRDRRRRRGRPRGGAGAARSPSACRRASSGTRDAEPAQP